MTAPARIRKPEMLRAAEVAKQTGCKIELRVGDTVFIAFPDDKPIKGPGIDYSRPDL